MKNFNYFILSLFISVVYIHAAAQDHPIHYFRPNNKLGLHQFETKKQDTSAFHGMKVSIGGNFTQDFQSLQHQNSATPVYDLSVVNINELTPLKSGFNLAMANLNIDAQLEDGIRLNLTMYLSTRHHPETWVKGGYIQLDKLPFLKSNLFDSIMKRVTIKIGSYEMDYGDQHYRRTDGGNAIFNPFIENYILDEFTTEIGGEIYYHPAKGFIALIGVSNGQLKPSVIASREKDSLTGKVNKALPAVHAKIGYDKLFTDDFRLRVTASFYGIKSTYENPLFFGDRTGSHYYFVMENTLATASGNAWSGRYNPQFRQSVTAGMFNAFIKYKGLEFFGSLELATGRMVTEKDQRYVLQYATDLIYRFPKKTENFWIGTRYNSVTGTVPGQSQSITINRIAGSLGWFVTKNILMKVEYVDQQYLHFGKTDIHHNGKFNGWMIEASIGF